MIELEYKSEIEKKQIINEQETLGLILTEVKNIAKKNALVFANSDEKIVMESEESQKQLYLLDKKGTMQRVLEDLIDILESKGIINITDLPQSAQNKIKHIKELRGKIIK